MLYRQLMVYGEIIYSFQFKQVMVQIESTLEE